MTKTCRTMLSIALLISAPIMPGTTHAGIYSDELAKCLVESTSNADKNTLLKWMFSAVSSHPEVKTLVSISDEKRLELSRNGAKLFERLLTEACGAKAKQAIKYEGASAIENSFNILGQVASRELFSDPSVEQSMADLTNHIDAKKMEAYFSATP